MSSPIRCEKCGTMIGVRSGVGGFSRHRQSIHYSEKPCKKHVPSVRTETEKMGYTEVKIDYPETHTESVFNEYRGDSEIVLKGLAIMLGKIYDKTHERWCWR